MKFYLNNFILIGRCLVRFLWRGRAHQLPNQISRVLVIQPAKLGDMVCTTPLFAAIKRHRPDWFLGVMGNQVNRSLLAGHPAVDHYLVYGEDIVSTLAMLKDFKPEVVILVMPHFNFLAAAYLSSAPLIIAPWVVGGFSPYQTKSYRLLTRLVRVANHQMNNYAPGEYLKLLEPLNIIETDTVKALTFSQAAKTKADIILNDYHLGQSDLIVGIAPGAGNKIKLWPAERFAQVADYLISKYKAKILIIGSPSDYREIKTMSDLVKAHHSNWHLLNNLSIEELKALIARLNLFISVDTGPIYIAEAFGVPTIDIVGPMSEVEQPPHGPKHVVVMVERAEPMLHIMNARVYDKVEARRQAESISVEMVCQAVDRLLS